MHAELRWVYPSPHHTTAEASVLLVGQTPTPGGLHLTCNGQTVETLQVSSQGFFGGFALLQPGENLLVLQAGPQKISRTVTRHQGSPPTEGMVQFPKHQIAGVAGFTVPLAAITPPGQKVIIADHHQRLALHTGDPGQQPADTRVNLFGQLHWFNQPSAETPWVPADCWHGGQWTLQSGAVQLQWYSQDASKTLHPMATLPVSVWPQPQWAVLAEEAVIRTGPSSHANRYKPLLPGTELAILGQLDDWSAFQLTENQLGWVQTEHLEPLGALAKAPVPVRLASVKHHTLTLPLAWLPPVQWQSTPQSLCVQIGHAVAQCDVIPQPDEGILEIAQRTSKTVQVAWQLGQPSTQPMAGVSVSTQPDTLGTPQWQITVNPWPKDPKQWKILLDAGHGGHETGSIAPNGQTEADVNLAITLACQQALQAAGVQQVELTRMANVDVSLADRVQQAARWQPHVCLSLHHNALPDGRNSLNHKGLATFYYHGHARPLAQHLLESLSSQLQCPKDGLYWDNLAMTRIHTATAVLIEWGYFTHPMEAERVLHPQFPQQAAKALTQALLSFRP